MAYDKPAKFDAEVEIRNMTVVIIIMIIVILIIAVGTFLILKANFEYQTKQINELKNEVLVLKLEKIGKVGKYEGYVTVTPYEQDWQTFRDLVEEEGFTVGDNGRLRKEWFK